MSAAFLAFSLLFGPKDLQAQGLPPSPVPVFVSTFALSAYRIVVDGMGNSYVVGFNIYNGSLQTTKLSPTGNLLWSNSFGRILVAGIAADSAGNVYVAGTDLDAQAGVLVKYGPDGSFIKSQLAPFAGPPNFAELGGVAFDSSRGILYAVGDHYNSSTGFQEQMVMAYNADLTLLSTQIQNEPLGHNLYGYGLALDAAGNVYTVEDVSTQTDDFAVSKYSPGLQSLVFHPVEGASLYPLSIAADASGNSFVVGVTAPTYSVAFIAKIYPGGALQFVKPYDGEGASSSEFNDVTTDGQGNVYVTGFTGHSPPGTSTMRTIKYSSDGNIIWNITPLSGAFTSAGRGIAVDAQNAIYVSGAVLFDPANPPGKSYVMKLSQGTSRQLSLSISTETDNQVGLVGSTLPVPLTALVQDQNHIAQSGVAVTFSTAPTPTNTQATGQSVSPAQIQTGSDGKASSVFTLGSVPADYAVSCACPSCDPSASSVTFHACGKLNVPYFNQGDSTTWASDPYDATSSSMSVKGCAVSSLAMLAQFYGVTTGADGKPVNPGNLNAWLNNPNNGGYDANHDLLWDAISAYTNGAVQWDLQKYNTPSAPRSPGTYTQAQLQDLIQQDLSQSLPLIAFVKNPTTGHPHFIVLASVCGIPSVVYSVDDPGNSGFTAWNSNGYVLYGIRRFKP